MASVIVKCLLVLCVVLPQIHAALNSTNFSSNHLALANVTVVLARQFVSKIATTVVIVERSSQAHMSNLNTQVLEYILFNLQKTVAIQLYFGQSESQTWDYHIFVVDSSRAFEEIHWNFPANCYERKFRFLIVLTKYIPRYFAALKSIFTISYQFHVINVSVILNHPTNGISMYTYKLFTAKRCRVVQPVLLWRLSNGLSNFTFGHFFREKLLNFHGCPIRVSARQYPPMLTFSGNTTDPKPLGNWQNLNGIDGQIIKAIAKKLNFAIELLPLTANRTFFGNNTGYGCFAQLLNDEADIGIGGFSASDPKRCMLSLSIPYHHSPVVFVVRVGREYNSISRLARPLNRRVWYLIAIILLSGTLLVHRLRAVRPAVRQFILGKRNNTPVLNMFAIFLGYSIVRVPHRNFARYLLILWLLMTIILRNAYQCSMYDTIRADRFVRIPSGFEQLLKWNYQIIVPHDIEKSDIFPKDRTIYLDNGYHYGFNILNELKGRYAVVALRDNYNNYMKFNFKSKDKLKLVNKPFFMQNTAMYFVKHSIYVAAINRNMRQLNYAGITRRIERNNEKGLPHFKGDKNAVSLKPISIDQLKGLYEIYVGMLALSLIVFALEWVSIYYKRLRRLIDWIN